MGPVLVCRDCGHEIHFRSFVYRKNDKYYAECIDLNLISSGSSVDEAIGKLQDAMFGYVSVAMEGNTAGLIPRRSPFSHRLRYHFQRLFSKSGHSGHSPLAMGDVKIEHRFSHCP